MPLTLDAEIIDVTKRKENKITKTAVKNSSHSLNGSSTKETTPKRRTTRSMKKKVDIKTKTEEKPAVDCVESDDDIICVLDTTPSQKRKSQPRLSNFFSKKPKLS